VVELRVILKPLTSLAIRTVPTEKDFGNSIGGTGLAGTLEEALKSMEELPIDP
jgi:hypothetical protein